MVRLLDPKQTEVRVRPTLIARAWDDPDARSVTIGILAVLLVHLLILLLAPRVMGLDAAVTKAPHRPPSRQYSIHLVSAPVPKAPPKQAPPNRFVETNPDAPENIPDKTTNFAARNQQAAQEKPQANAHNDHPELKGRTDVKSTQIVSGQLTKSLPPAPPAAPPRPVEKTAQLVRRAQNPLSGFERNQGDNPNGPGTDISKPLPNPQAVKQKVDGSPDAPLIEGLAAAEPDIDPHRPRPRQSLAHAQVRPAIFEDNKVGTSNIGLAGYDARWSNYGAYLQRMVETIQIKWDQILIGSAVPPHAGHVTVKFRLNSKGEIEQILPEENSSSEQGRESCLSAITLPAPYGVWTDDMVAVLGNSQDLTFVFYYDE